MSFGEGESKRGRSLRPCEQIPFYYGKADEFSGASRPIFHPDFRDNTDRRDHQNHLSVGSTINGGLVESVSDPSTIASGRVEAPEIAALLKAQRTCSPIAIAVAQDYSSAPFKVPRPFVVLGWFWVVDAWVRGCYAPNRKARLMKT